MQCLINSIMIKIKTEISSEGMTVKQALAGKEQDIKESSGKSLNINEQIRMEIVCLEDRLKLYNTYTPTHKIRHIFCFLSRKL